MAETGNYQLKQWEKTDRIQMEDFNADNAKTDQALAEQNDELVALSAAAALYGNCQLVAGSYIGNGGSGESSARTLTFDSKPMLLFIHTLKTYGSNHRMMLVRGAEWGWMSDYDTNASTVTWGDKSITWYGKTAVSGANNSGSTYFYVALLAQGE